MSAVQFAGADVLRGKVHLSLRGTWFAEFELDTPTAPSGAAALAASGKALLQGFVVDGGVFLDAAHVRAVGGAGGLGKLVSGSYRGAQLGDVVGAVMTGSGETASSTIDRSITSIVLPLFTLSGSAAKALDDIAGAAARELGAPVSWRVLADGTIWIGQETWPAQTLPDGSEVLEPFPGERRFVIGADAPALLPGVNLADVGQVIAVDHYIESSAIRTWAWTSPAMGELTQSFLRLVRLALGLPSDPTSLPRVDRLAQYRAEVKTAATDGSTVDVAPEDARLPPMQGVPLRVAIPGLTVVAKAGSVVLIGWERGDPSRPYAVPSWEQTGGVCSSLTFEADAINLVSSGAKAAARKGDAVNLGDCHVVMASGAVSAVFINGVALPVGTDVPDPPDRGGISGGSAKVKIG